MSELKIIDQRNVMGKDFKIYGDFENPLFLAKDIAGWIDYSDSNVAKLVGVVDNNEKVRNIVTTLGGNQEAWFVTEDGLMEILFQSRKPIAKEFKKQVKEILRTIRKHGMFATDELLNNPDLAIKAFTALKEEREKTKLLIARVEQDKPKVLFADSVSASHTTILVGELAKILKQNGVDTGQNRLFEWMRKNGYLITRKGTDYNMPTQKAMDMKLFEIKETSINHSDGHVSISKTAKVTGKGQVYFINKFLNIENQTA